MAKKRLVDFRGGINKKISPHMIGDSQGQSAQDTDLSAVRLQGRKKLDTAEKAKGYFFYDAGSSNEAGLWVTDNLTTHPSADIDVAGATDYAVWNRDLYVSTTTTPGEVRRFLDGAISSSSLTISPPASFALAYDFAFLSNLSNWVTGVDNAGDGNLLVAANAGRTAVLEQAAQYAWSDVFTAFFTLDSNTVHGNSTDFAADADLYWGTLGITSIAQTVSGTQLTIPVGADRTQILSIHNAIVAQQTAANTYGNRYSNALLYDQSKLPTLANNDAVLTIRTTKCSSDTAETDGIFVIAQTSTRTEIQGNVLRVGSTNTVTGDANWSGVLYEQVSTTGSGGDTSLSFLSYGSNSALYDANKGYPRGNGRYFSLTMPPPHSWKAANYSLNPPEYSHSPEPLSLKDTGTSSTPELAKVELGVTQRNYIQTSPYVAPVTYIPPTAQFTHDDARLDIYRQFDDTDTDSSVWDTDAAEGAASPGWLSNRSLSSKSEDGYYLSTISGTTGTVTAWTGLPAESQGKVSATIGSSNNVPIMSTGALRSPMRLNLSSINAAANDTTTTQSYGDKVACYKLYRVDSTCTLQSPISLGYINPHLGTTNTFSYDSSGSDPIFKITNLSSSKHYRLYWKCYQKTTLTVVTGTETTTSKSPGTFGTDGVSFTGISTGSDGSTTDTFSITLNSSTDSGEYEGVDFWLEERVIDNSGTNDTYAVIRCFDFFKYNNTSTDFIQNNSNFLDAFASGIGQAASSGSNLSAPPNYLKFLKESNNFFFGVGTADTADNRYGTVADNKEDSYLFVSSFNNPRDWPIASYVEFEDSITGIAPYFGELVVFLKSGLYRVTGSRSDQMRKVRIPSVEGLQTNQEKSIALVGKYIVWVSQSGICFYDGTSVTNLTRGRYLTSPITETNLVAGQFENKYYVIRSNNETGFMVDFNLEGFPVTEIDLTEGDTTSSNPKVLHYVASENKLYSNRGVVEGNSTNNTFSFRTRGFDGGSFGALKLVKNVTINGIGSGKVQIYLDNRPVFSDNSSTGKSVNITDSSNTEPARIYLPSSRSDPNKYGLSIADIWDVEIKDWNGQIDWIETEYEILAD